MGRIYRQPMTVIADDLMLQDGGITWAELETILAAEAEKRGVQVFSRGRTRKDLDAHIKARIKAGWRFEQTALRVQAFAPTE